jgi:hypothetical protein
MLNNNAMLKYVRVADRIYRILKNDAIITNSIGYSNILEHAVIIEYSVYSIGYSNILEHGVIIEYSVYSIGYSNILEHGVIIEYSLNIQNTQ